MPEFVPISGPVVADTAYMDNKLCARDVSITLPEVAAMMADVWAMGPMSMPNWALIENMEATITKIGVDMGLSSIVKPGMKNVEFRWVQTVTDANGNNKNVGRKAFIRGQSTKIPAIGITIGEPSENECPLAVTRYALFVDGEEMWLIDRLAGKCRIGGVDYASEINSML